MQGTVGYMAQTPWVMSGTFQANVTFGENVEQERYRQVLHACALYKVIPGSVTLELARNFQKQTCISVVVFSITTVVDY